MPAQAPFLFAYLFFRPLHRLGRLSQYPAVFVVGEDVPDIDDQPTTFDRRDQPERISVGVNDGENIDEVRVRKVPPHFVDVYPLGAFPDGGSASRFPSHPVFSRDNSKFLAC
jgi:hypothetical protein